MTVENANTSLAGRRILVIDDNRDVADALVALLSVLGFAAAAVYSGALALNAAAVDAPALVFLDLDMPEMTGFETLRRLKAQGLPATTRVVALTARSGAEDREHCRLAGFDQFVCKPIDPDVLCRLAAEATGRAAPPLSA